MRGLGGSAFLTAIALVAGTAVGYCLAPGAAQEAAPEASGTTTRPDKAPIADNGDAASVKALRVRVTELERMLAERHAAEEAAATNAVATVPQPPEPRRGGGREWMENLKKSNPERYAQITNNLAQMRRQQAERLHRNLDFLASVDTSRMSAKAKNTHAALQKRLALREELMDQLHASDGQDITDEQRRDVWRQIRENEEVLRQAVAAIPAIGKWGEGMGKEFSDRINRIDRIKSWGRLPACTPKPWRRRDPRKSC